MSGIIVAGKVVPVLGRHVVTWQDDPRVRLSMPEDGRKRQPGVWIRQVILHTTRGIPGGSDHREQVIRPGRGQSTWAKNNIARMWADDDRNSGAHFVVDFDCTWYQLADPATELTYHATTANSMSIGIEVKQGGDAELYADQIGSAVDLCNVLTEQFGIQRQTQSVYRKRPVRRLSETGGMGRDVVGVFGHRDQTARRGSGDPGDAIIAALVLEGYDRFDFDADEDIKAWKERQAALGLVPDGVPGPMTAATLKAKGYGGGLWAMPPAEKV